jgi:transposase
MNEKIKQERLAQLKAEHMQLSLEVIVLIDSWTLKEVEEIFKRRREIAKRIDELEARISATDRSWANTW